LLLFRTRSNVFIQRRRYVEPLGIVCHFHRRRFSRIISSSLVTQCFGWTLGETDFVCRDRTSFDTARPSGGCDDGIWFFLLYVLALEFVPFENVLAVVALTAIITHEGSYIVVSAEVVHHVTLGAEAEPALLRAGERTFT